MKFFKIIIKLIYLKMEDLNLDNKSEQNEEPTEESKNKSLIIFSKINKLYLIPFLFAIFSFLFNLFEGFIYISQVIKYPNHGFIKSILFDLPNILAGLFYFIPNIQVNVDVKKKLNDKDESNLVENYIYKKNFLSLINTKKPLILILLLGLMFAINDLSWAFIYDATVFEQRLFYLFFIPLFSKIILKENIYRHQYLSLLISLIGCIFLIIPVCFKLKANFIIPNILNFINGINFPLYIVLIKYIVEKFYFPPLKISLIVGIISIIINFIGYIIYSLIINDFSSFTDCFDFSNGADKLTISIYFILFILFATASSLTLYLSIFYFSPTLITVTNMISPFLFWIAIIIVLGESIIGIILNPIGYFITLFSTLIYNELIILNCCHLNRNTKKYLNKRIYKELEEIRKDEEDIFRNETREHSLLFDNN